ncbi:phosphate ABC transporter permease PstA [Pararhizobium haloflavum]|uniref:phosphate ABC transporter permease PstA n=1 Tax=Pararhizobium haloflavum TaxID=2037914 RepID=UPI000C19793B|nr:phosphate ABC transporter permease PstA [Pararhizobium haloflavum]
MTDTTRPPASGWADEANRSNIGLKRRHARSRRLQGFGIGAIALAILMLGTLLWTMVSTGYSAFVQTHLSVEVTLSPEEIDAQSPGDANYRDIMQRAWLSSFDNVTEENEGDLLSMLSRGAELQLRNLVIDDPSLIGQTIQMEVPAADDLDQVEKGFVSRATPEEYRIVNDRQIEIFYELKQDGRVSTPFNTALFTEADSRFPELAGLKGALIGSFFALLVCFVLSFPIGIAAAIYLEEFAPKNRWTDLIEVNINNLAAVPSIVFGLLGLAVFIGFLGFPRSIPLVGGMVLALMTLPTIIISTRAALKAVPPSVREAALGVGASKLQTVLHHVLPLALPGIMTGTIIGMAQALGETAPLLLIGMNAFITAAPDSMMSPSTALPTQIYIWADSPERGFTARTSAAIMVLLGFMIIMNGIAIYLRKRLETRW